MVTTPLCTYFSDRATISGHDNPVFNNLADVEVYSWQMLSGEHYNGFEEQLEESHNKWIIFSSPQILHHAPNSTQDSSDNYVCRGIKRRTEHVVMLKLFTQMDFINRVDITASTSYCAKLSQKNLSRLIWSYVKLNIQLQRKITHLFQKNPEKFDLIKHEISDSMVRWKSGTVENESDLKEFASTWLIIQTVTTDEKVQNGHEIWSIWGVDD